MENITTLASLREGQCCRVKSLLIEGAMRSRLGELGLIEGARVECVHRNVSGDPAAYCICGALIALRNSDSSGVIVYTS